MKKNLIFLLLLIGSYAYAQNCNNVGFESGTSGWTCKSGQYGISPGPCTPEVKIETNGCINAGDNSTLDPVNQKNNRHTIMSNTSQMDPNAGAVGVPCVAPGNLFPSGVNTKSFRIGNGVAGGFDPSNPNSIIPTASMAESISFSFVVDATNAGLTYMYAVFLNEAKTNKHSSEESPRFIVKITTASGQVNCGLYNVDASEDGGSNDFLTGGPGLNDGQWKYRNWTKVALDLTSYIGQTVTIEFITADCLPKTGSSTSNGVSQCNFGPGGHSAYAYIDLYCTPLEIVSPPVCANQPSVQICGPDGYASYEWDPSGPGIQPPYTGKCVTIKNPKSGDEYTVTMKSVAGACPTKTKIKLKGSDFTIANVSTCPNKPIKITPTPTSGTLSDFEWKWEPKQNLDRYDIAEPTFTPGTTTTYTVTMVDKDIKNCDQVKLVTVTVGSGFSITPTGATICEGDEATLTVTGGADSYKWEPGGLTGTSIKVKPATTTVYTVTGTSASSSCGTEVKENATVTVNKKPIITVSDQTICIGETAKLTGSITGGTTTGKWIGGTGEFIPNRNTINASYKPSADEIAAGSVSLVLESDAPLAPCVKDSKPLTISIVPAVTSDAGPDQTICETGTVTLAGKFGGAATGGSWSGGSGTFSPANTDPNAVYTPGNADILAGKVVLKYTVSNGTNATCPGGIDDMTIFIDKKPSVSAGADITVCLGESAKLLGSVGGSATTATWSGGTGTFSPSSKTLTATYTPSDAEMKSGQPIVLTLTTDPSGKCPVTSDVTTITINQPAVVNAGQDQKICVGTPVQLAGVASGGATSGVWTGGSGIYQPNNNTANALYTPSAAEIAAKKVVLTFTTNDPVGPCPAVSDEMVIEIDQLPVATILNILPVCAGGSIKLNGSVSGAATSGTWSGGTGKYTKDNMDLTGTYTPTDADIANGKVKIYLTTNKTGLCPIHVDSVTIPIYSNPVINFTVDTPKACPDHCVKFTDASTVAGGNITNWNWFFGNDSAKSQNPNTCFPLAGFYDITLKATSDKGCSTTLTKPQFVQTYEKPKANFTANPMSVSQYDPTINFYDKSSADVVSWKWNLGDGKIITPKTQNPVHKYEVGIAQTYLVKLFVVNANGCVDSTQKTVEVLPEFTFYIPNAFTPFRDDKVNDTFFGKGVGIVQYHLWIFDRWGNQVFNTTDIDTGWDGRANGGQDISQQDVFVWKVKLTDVFGKKHDYIGTVTLVR